MEIDNTLSLNDPAKKSIQHVNSAGSFSMDEAVAIHLFTETVFQSIQDITEFICEEKIPRFVGCRQFDYIVRGSGSLFLVSVVRAWVHELSRRIFDAQEAERLMKKKIEGLIWAERAVAIPDSHQGKLVLQILAPNTTNAIWCLRSLESMNLQPSIMVFITILRGPIKKTIFCSSTR